MTLKQEAIQMVNQLPDEKIKYVIKFMQGMDSSVRKGDENSPKMQAFQNLEKIRLHLPEHFDYEKELGEAREEKYGNIS